MRAARSRYSSPRSRSSRRSGSGIAATPAGAEIRRNVVVGEIAPALERPHRPLHHRDHLGLHHQPAASDAVLVAERLDRDELFARRDFTADHPIQRAAVEHLVDALRRHAGDMNVMRRQALLLGGSDALRDPALQLLDGLTTDGKLDDMKRHYSSCELRFRSSRTLTIGTGDGKHQSFEAAGVVAGAGAAVGAGAT